jgi:hypothetical protein
VSVAPPPPASPSGSELGTDWSHFDPHAYLNEYYADLGPENLALLRFFAQVYQDLPEGGVLLDFGGGPTIYPLISAVTRVAEIHFSDYLDANLAEVRGWLAGKPGAFDWTPFIRKSLEFEGGPATDAAVEHRAKAIRQHVTRVMHCDASRTPPIEDGLRLYDVVLTNFCAESATSDRAQWELYMANIGTLLKPGGWLVMSALKGATQYSVGPRSFPAVDISEHDLVELLEENHFPRKGIEVRTVPADRPSRDYKGLLLAAAQKEHSRMKGRM